MVRCWGDSLEGNWTAAEVGISPSMQPLCGKNALGRPVCASPVFSRRENQPDVFTVVRVYAPNQTMTLTRNGDEGSLQIPGRSGTVTLKVHKPLEAYASKKMACLVSEAGPWCFLEGSKESTPLSSMGLFFGRSLYFFEPGDIAIVLSVLASDVYSFDADLFRSAAALLASATPRQQEVGAYAFSTMLSDFPYKGVRDTKMPYMTNSIREVLRRDRSEKILTDEDRGFVTRLMVMALQTMRPVLLRVSAVEGQVPPAKDAEEIIGLLGRAMASGAEADLKVARNRLVTFAMNIGGHGYVGMRSPMLLYLEHQL